MVSPIRLVRRTTAALSSSVPGQVDRKEADNAGTECGSRRDRKRHPWVATLEVHAALPASGQHQRILGFNLSRFGANVLGFDFDAPCLCGHGVKIEWHF